MLARRVVLVLDLPLADGDVTEAAPPERHPAPRAVLPHHHLRPHPDQVVPAAEYVQYLLTYFTLYYLVFQNTKKNAAQSSDSEELVLTLQ